MNQEKIILLLTKFVEKLYTNFSYVYFQWFIYINRLRRHLKINAINGINFIGKGEINRHNDFYRTQMHPSPSNKNNAVLLVHEPIFTRPKHKFVSKTIILSFLIENNLIHFE